MTLSPSFLLLAVTSSCQKLRSLTNVPSPSHRMPSGSLVTMPLVSQVSLHTEQQVHYCYCARAARFTSTFWCNTFIAWLRHIHCHSILWCNTFIAWLQHIHCHSILWCNTFIAWLQHIHCHSILWCNTFIAWLQHIHCHSILWCNTFIAWLQHIHCHRLTCSVISMHTGAKCQKQ